MSTVNNTVVLHGGITNKGYTSEMYLLDVTSMRWISKSPPGTYGHSLITASNKIILFGGATDSGFSNQLYVFDSKYNTWALVTDGGTMVPPARYYHAVASRDKTMFLFGGMNDEAYLDDLYALDTEEYVWTLIEANGERPNGRGSHAMVFVDQLLFMFGGYSYRLSNELFVLNTSSLTWSQPLASGQPPSPRMHHSMVCEGKNIYIYGGETESEYSDELFVLDTGTLHWRLLYPPGRIRSSMSSFGSLIVMFGGYASNQKLSSDLFVLDAHSMQWNSPPMSGPLPSARWGHKTVVVEDRLFLFGGDTDTVYSDELYELNLVSMTWSLKEKKDPTPSARWGHAMVAARDGVFLFGGKAANGYQNDLYLLDVSSCTWKLLETNGTKPWPRWTPAMATHSGSILLFGGYGIHGYSNELYLLDTEQMSWRVAQVSGSIPSPRSESAMAVINDMLYVIGGVDVEGALNDMFVLDLTDSIWKQEQPVKSWSRAWGQASSTINKTIFVYGGYTGSDFLSDLIIYDVSTMQDDVLASPTGRCAHSATMVDKSMLVFGGYGNTGSSLDMYKLQLSNLRWSLEDGGGYAPLVKSYGQGMAAVESDVYTFGGYTNRGYSAEFFKFDLVKGAWEFVWPRSRAGHSSVTINSEQIALFGGYSGYGFLDELVLFNISNLQWTLPETTGTKPLARYGHAMTAVGDEVFVHGGYTSNGLAADLHTFNTKSATWSYVSTANFPPARYAHGIAAVGNHLYLFGGLSYSGFSTDLYVLDLSSMQWERHIKRTNPRYDVGMTAVNRLLVFVGGYFDQDPQPMFAIFNSSSMSWINLSIQKKPIGRRATASFASSNKLYVHGGQSIKGYSAELMAFDKNSMTWTYLTPQSRSAAAMCAVGDLLYIHGGDTDTGLNDELFVLNTSSLTWSQPLASGQPPSPRMHHSMVCEGKNIYIYGGETESEYSDELFLLNINTAIWVKVTQVGEKPSARSGQAMVEHDGLVYVHGGLTADGLSSELFALDIANMRWSKLQGNDTMPSARRGHSLVSVGESLFLFGGKLAAGSSNEVFLYDSSSNSWTLLQPSAASEPSARYAHAMSAERELVYMLGGMTETGISDEFWLFNMSSNTWERKVLTSAFSSKYASTIALVNNRLFSFGGETSNGVVDDLDVISTQSLDLLHNPDKPDARVGHSIVLVGGSAYLFGGYTNDGFSGDLFSYDILSSKWSRLLTTGSAPGAREFHAMAAGGTDIFVFGGVCDSGYLNDLFVLDTNSMRWSAPALSGSPPPPCIGSSMAAYAGGIFLLGGYGYNGYYDQLYRLDVETSSWGIAEVTGSQPSPRANQGLIVRDDKLYLFGGDCFLAWSNEFHILDLSSLHWTNLSFTGKVPNPRWGTAFALVENDVIMYGGSNSTDMHAADFFEDVFILSLSNEIDVHQTLTNELSLQLADRFSTFVSSHLVLMDRDLVLCSANHPCIYKLQNMKVMWQAGSVLCGEGCRLAIAGSQISCDSSRLVSVMFDMQGAKLSITNSSFSNCFCSSDGCSLLLQGGSSAKLVNTTFAHLKNDLGGAAVTVSASDLDAYGCQFKECESRWGGAIFSFFSSTENVKLSWSSSKSVWRSHVTVGRSLFQRCAGEQGGSVFSADSVLALSDVIFESNSAAYGGALYMADASALTLHGDVTFNNNSASVSGGAIYFDKDLEAAHGDLTSRCTNDNRALSWGSCVGTSYHRLSLDVMQVRVFPGIAARIIVKKLDLFDQVITTGNELLQLLSVKNGSLDIDTSIMIVGNSVARLNQGVAEFLVSFKPTFTKMDVRRKQTKIDSHPLIYVEGIDLQSSATMSSDLHTLVLQSDSDVCPTGYILSLSSELPSIGGCVICGRGSYSVDPFAGGPACFPCPAGGVCDHGGSNVSFPVGHWMLESGEYRVQSCPPGHSLVREEAKAARDDCPTCPYGSYSIASQHISNATGCLRCPTTVTCMGGMNIRARKGFYVISSAYVRTALRRSPGQELLVFRCATSACLEGNQCLQGYMGPACGFCNSTEDEKGRQWMRVGNECVLCSENESLVPFLTVLLSLAALVWIGVFWFPIWESMSFWSRGVKWLQLTSEHVGGMLVSTLERASLSKAAVQDLKSLLTTSVKIVIGFYQVTLTFVRNFNVSWPTRLTDVISSVSFLSLDFFSLPATDCLCSSLSWMQKLYVVTLIPLVVVGLIVLPGLVAMRMDVKVRRVVTRRVMFWLLFFLFTAYPFVSSTILQTFSCMDLGPVGNFLRADFTVTCPLETRGREFKWAIIFTFIYPLGVPLFILAVLFYYQVPQLARRKVLVAKLQAVVEKLSCDCNERDCDGSHLQDMLSQVYSCSLLADPLLLLSQKDMQTLCSFLQRRSTQQGSSINMAIERHNQQSLDFMKLIDAALDQGDLSLPKLRWESDSQTRWREVEETAIEHAGFLFDSYRVEVWYFESIEMVRKLVMTSLIVFIFQGSYLQVAFAAFFTFLALILHFLCQPLTRPCLDQQQGLSLTIQFVTLFYGLTLILEDEDVKSPADATYKALLEYCMIGLNSFIAFYIIVKFLLVQMFRSAREMLISSGCNKCSKRDIRVEHHPSLSYSNFSYMRNEAKEAPPVSPKEDETATSEQAASPAAMEEGGGCRAISVETERPEPQPCAADSQQMIDKIEVEDSFHSADCFHAAGIRL